MAEAGVDEVVGQVEQVDGVLQLDNTGNILA